MNIFSVVGQKHSGWVAFFQEEILGCLGCIWFNRGESNDRKITAQRYHECVSGPDETQGFVNILKIPKQIDFSSFLKEPV